MFFFFFISVAQLMDIQESCLLMWSGHHLLKHMEILKVIASDMDQEVRKLYYWSFINTIISDM